MVATRLFYRMMSDRLILGAGMPHLEKDALDRYRASVADDSSGSTLVTTLNRIQAAGRITSEEGD